MQTFLSFKPRYHELTCRDGKPVWVPMYNPIRECVQTECQRIKGEFGVVDSTAWVRPAVKKMDGRELWSQVFGLVLYFGGALALGWLMSKVPLLEGVLDMAPADRRVAGMMAMGGAVLSLGSIVVVLVRRKNIGPGSAPKTPEA